MSDRQTDLELIDLSPPPDGFPNTETGRRADQWSARIRAAVTESGAAILAIDSNRELSFEGRAANRARVFRAEVARLLPVRDEVIVALDRSLGRRADLVRSMGPAVDYAALQFVWTSVRDMGEVERISFLAGDRLAPVVAQAVLLAPAVPPFDQIDEAVKDLVVRRAIGSEGIAQLDAWQADHDALKWVKGMVGRALNRAQAAQGGGGEVQPDPDVLSVAEVVRRSAVTV